MIVIFSGATEFLSTVCPPGSYCPVGTRSPTEYLCPRRTFFNETGATDLSDCLPCTGGYYCDVDGMSAPAGPCDEGLPSFVVTKKMYSD